MSRKERHNAEVRARIVSGAGALFRAHGFDGVGIDALMAEADLTRGAFYAHFASKEALFEAVVATEHPLLAILRRRPDADRDTLWTGMQKTFAGYLAPEHHDAVFASCGVAALSKDVARRSDTAKRAYEAAHRAIRAEIVRGQGISPDDPRIMAALTLAVGALGTAAACAGAATKAAILTAAHETFTDLTTRARKEARP